jgi:hypothetical protein
MNNASKFKAYLNQNYDELKKECLASKKLFEDDRFPADETSIKSKFEKNQKLTNMKWKRPSEFSSLSNELPKFIVSKNIVQGELGIYLFFY